MGRVFSLEQIRHSDETIPLPHHFEQAKKDFEQTVLEELEAGTIVSAEVFGSVAINAYDVMSDFDCVTVPTNHSPESQAAIDRILAVTSQAGRIEVNPIQHTKQRLTSGNHEIDRFFGEHLTGVSRMVYGEDIAEYIRFGMYDAATIVKMYIEHKMRSIAPAATPNSPKHFEALQRTLELPLAIGRKALRALDEVRETTFATSDSANRSRIMPHVLELFDQLEVGTTARELLELGRLYKQCLPAVLDGSATEKDYVAMLAEIRAISKDANEWLDVLSPLLAREIADGATLPVA